MTNAITGYQSDKAEILAAQIANETGDTIAISRIQRSLREHGIVNDLTYWERVELVLRDFGYDYDEIFEVMAR